MPINRISNLKENWNQNVPFLKNKVTKLYGNGDKQYNPLLNSDGSLFNKYLDYQGLLDNPNVSAKAKQFISDATGLTPTVVSETPAYQPSQGKAVTPTEQKTVTPSATNTGNGIADSAQKYLGTPYVWGGESMDEGGMDCSGFVYNALKDAGYNVGRTTAQGYRNYGTKVDKSELQAGDLLFFGSGEASHIGIYLGNGQMIHSSGGSKNTKDNPGKGVNITSINHRSDFIEARRY